MEGEQSFWLGDEFFHVDAGCGENARPKVLTYVLNRETEIRLLRGTDKPLRKISITTPLTWMEEFQVDPSVRHEELARFLSGHLNHMLWEPGPDVLALCRQIENPPKGLEGEMRELYLSLRGLDILIAVCQRISSGNPSCLGPALSSNARMDRIQDYLLAHLDERLTIAQIARETGTSVRSLQRKFRDHFGVSVSEYLRQARLIKARDALLRDGITVSQAAAVAGYNGIGSFSAAFKKHFGECPSLLRTKV
ncbi:helix-turn-helix domain-containing protein [Roseibium aggregatum]|uniref:Helix-turn-helix transcriptional regulator n=1 Tax=Roseibium aggregatum TaxID=187304 RepID=A0A939EIY3_9HYPH|nr:AraC family transcriptional regulator [Roseibium aggregatum]MBN9673252.1 helix-turn-helix transcriptional regulator [Roseibium aggregatum]